MSAAEKNPNDCIHCGGWTCSHCKPPHDAGEQGLTADEKEMIALRRRVRELEATLKLCVSWMPCAEVRSWPPGFRLREEALAAARSLGVAP